MATPEKPTRLGRGLDALLNRPPTARPNPPANAEHSAQGKQPNTATSPVASSASRSAPNAAADKSESSSSAAQPTGRTSAPGEITDPVSQTSVGLRNLPIAAIAANPFQPRKEFRPEELADLESSLRQSGILQPITVRPSPHHSGYELIAGERRLRAATRLGWTEIPALIRLTDDRTMLTLAMVENLQRADLDPIEEADGYQRLVEEFDLTQQEVADVVGKDRSTIANALRLLALPASVKRMLQERQLTVGHARALLPLADERAIADLSRDIVAQSLSVRDVENRVRRTRPSPATSGRKAKPETQPATNAVAGNSSTAEARRIEEMLRKKMQTTVHLHLSGKAAGEVRIAFYSNDDLERVLGLMGIDIDS
jgi:ParB family chromosome partitioning protein